MKYVKIRGILRAKNGSQIPKFLNPASPLPSINTNSLGSMFALPKTLGSDPIGSLLKAQLDEARNYSFLGLLKVNWSPKLPPTSQDKFYLNTLNTALGKLQSKYSSLTNTNLLLDKTLNPSLKDKLGAIGNLIGNFANANQGMITTGINAVTDKLFGGTEDSGEFGAVTGAIGMLLNVPGPVGWYATAANTVLKGINKLGASKVDNTYIDLNVAEKAGGSYADTMALGQKAMSNNDKEFGLFNRGGYRSAKRTRNEYLKQQGVLRGIVNEADDLRAMVNDLNYLGYQMQQLGGFDLLNMGLRAKQGAKLDTKINLVKSRKFNLRVKVDTKLVEEFKDGGSITISEITLEWEPNFDAVLEFKEEETWEPVIVEEFKDGGKTKEELETPEIEETTQKNIIPEGALHKNKHHIENTEGLTLKGIPVIDNEGEQQAEVECEEIIFNLEVTKALEERYHKFYSSETKQSEKDLLAIEAGKLLVEQILYNTDDRAGLIAKCLEGGKLCQ